MPFVRKLCRAVLCVALFTFCLISSVLAQTKTSSAPVGLWHGIIQGKAGEVNFIVDLQQQNGTLHASLVNGTDRQPFSSATFDNGVLTLRIDYYDGQLTLRLVSPDQMEGEYSRQTSKGMVHIPVALEPHHAQGRR